MVNLNLNDKDIKELAFKNDNVRKFIKGRKIINTIIVPNRLINIVVK